MIKEISTMQTKISWNWGSGHHLPEALSLAALGSRGRLAGVRDAVALNTACLLAVGRGLGRGLHRGECQLVTGVSGATL